MSIRSLLMAAAGTASGGGVSYDPNFFMYLPDIGRVLRKEAGAETFLELTAPVYGGNYLNPHWRSDGAEVLQEGFSSAIDRLVPSGGTLASAGTLATATDVRAFGSGLGVLAAVGGSSAGQVLAWSYTDGVPGGYTALTVTNSGGYPNTVGVNPVVNQLLIGSFSSPYFQLRNRSGNSFNSATLSYSASYGEGAVQSFSPDGARMIVKHSATPWLSMYSKNASHVYSRLSTPNLSNVRNARYSPVGNYLVAWTSFSDVTLYDYTGAHAYTLRATMDLLAANGGYGGAIGNLEWSADGNYICITGRDGLSNNDLLLVFRRNGSTSLTEVFRKEYAAGALGYRKLCAAPVAIE